MKLTSLLLIIATFQLFASGVYSQETELTLKLGETSVGNVLTQIENQSDFYFLFNQKLVDTDRQVFVNIENRKIKEILDQVFSGTDTDYFVMDRQIVLSPSQFLAEARATLKENAALQPRTVNGTVRDESGEPVVGANVVIKGTTTGTISSANGTFSLEVEGPSSVLVVSAVGYATREIQVGNQTQLDITLEVDLIGLDEIVVIGYGTRKKSDLTGSIFSVSEDEIQNGISSNLSERLKGVIPGVNIFQTSGAPGSQTRIRIRGSSSITGGNSPLYVIDGVPFDDSPTGGSVQSAMFGDSRVSGLNSVNSDDIKSVEVLKGPSAVAIYGSRGSNGVILITTKNGESAGPIKINYKFETGFKEPTKKLDVLNTQDFMQIRNDVAEEYGDPPIFTPEEMATITGSDWQDEIFRKGFYQDHNLSFNGGNNTTRYFASFNYHDEDGIIISSGIKRYNTRFNLEMDPSEKFHFGVRLNVNKTDSDLVPSEGNTNVTAGIANTAIEMDPTLGHDKLPNGKYPTPSNFLDNPLNIAEGIDAIRDNFRTYGNASAEYRVIPELSAMLRFGADLTKDDLKTYMGRMTLNGEAQGGIADLYNATRFNTLTEFLLSYEKDFGEHNLSLLGGVTYEKFIYDGNGMYIIGFPTDETSYYNLGLGDTESDELRSTHATHSLLSYIARANYLFSDKYLLTATFRADGSSRFGANNKFGYFPSAAFAWRLSNEDFISQLDVFSNLKLRLSWGITGNQEIGNYNSLATFEVAGTPVTFNNVIISTLQPARLPNPDLRWEQTEEFNVGLDMGFFKGRLSGSIDYFRKTTRDLLFAKPIPSNTGFSTILDNIGSVQNNGIELFLESVNISGPFSWSTTLNFSYIKNEVLDLGPVDEIIHGSILWSSQIGIIREGAEMNSYYGHEVTGIWQEGDDIANSAQPFAQPGFLKLKDQDGDGQINANDLVILGNPEPDVTYGIMNTFSYKNFDLSVFFQGVTGVELLDGNWTAAFYPIDYTRNRMAEPWLNRWTPSNPTNKYPSGIEYNSYGGSQVNTLTVQDGSFIRLQNIQLRYTIPVSAVNFIRSASITAMVNNAITWTKFNGYNPEGAKGTEMAVRAAANGYPLARTYSLGIRLGF